MNCRFAIVVSCIFVTTWCAGWKAKSQTTERGSVTVNVGDFGNSERPIVGTYYYPWYETRGRRSSWRSVFRQRLDPPQVPKAGLYRSSDPDVIQEHISQSQRAGISFWAVSWWGPNSPTDRNFKDAILTHPEAKQLRFAMLYESTGRFGEFDNPDYGDWESDLEYLREHYFRHPLYLRINDRPVLFVYLTREYFRGKGHAQLRQARQLDGGLYIVGDDVFGPNYREEWARSFDAVTAYDVYGQSVGIKGTTREAVTLLADNFRRAREVSSNVGTAFIPAVTPGYNDTVIRNGHPAMPRYFVNDEKSKEGDVFRTMIQDAALPNLDPRTGRMIMVTSFNEWYEDSQIEATAGGAPASQIDVSSSQQEFTEGHRYEDYSFLYLDILRDTVR